MTRLGLATTLFMAVSTVTLAAETIEVPLGGAGVVRLGQAARQVVVGNPAIADVTMQSPQTLAVFGKYPGGTTLLVLDGGGRVVLDATVVVVSAGADGDGVTVRYGTGKTWVPGGTTAVADCSAVRCSPAMTLPSETIYKAGGGAPPPVAAPAPAK